MFPLSFSVFMSFIFLFFVFASSKQKRKKKKRVIFHLVTVSDHTSRYIKINKKREIR